MVAPIPMLTEIDEVCKKHKIPKKLIGSQFGSFIYRCEKCFKETIKYLNKEKQHE